MGETSELLALTKEEMTERKHSSGRRPSIELKWLGSQFGVKRKRDQPGSSDYGNPEQDDMPTHKQERQSMLGGSVSVDIKYLLSRNRRLKASTFSFLEGCRTTSSKVYHALVFLIIILSLALGITLTVEEYQKNANISLALLCTEFLLLVIFVTEYCLRIWSCTSHGVYGKVEGRLRFLVTPHMVIDFLVILASLGLITASFMHLSPKAKRLLSVLQLLRILKVDRQRGAFSMFRRVMLKHKKELVTCWYMSFIMVMFVSFLVFAVEERETGEFTLDNLFNGFYWGVISFTSIGYGDISPTTVPGKAIIVCFAILGTAFLSMPAISLTSIGYGDISPNTISGKALIVCFAIIGTAFFSMPAGIIGSGFALQVAEQAKEKHANRKRRPAAVLIQSVWRRFAADQDFPGTWTTHIIGRERNLIRQSRQENLRLSRVDQPSQKVSSSSKVSAPSKISRAEVFNMLTLTMPESKANKSGENGNGLARLKGLTNAEKIALRFIRRLKIAASLKNFRQARRPYDERDILDQFAAGQIEMFAKLKHLSMRIDKLSNNLDRQAKSNTVGNMVMSLEEEVDSVKKQVGCNTLMLQEVLKRVPSTGEQNPTM